MKLGIISDLHLEFRKTHQIFPLVTQIEKSDYDVLINAGDTHPAAVCRNLFEMKDRQEYLEVLGNHDFYGQAFGYSKWTKEIRGKTIVGCTLWVDFKNGDNLAEFDFRRCLVDFRQISSISSDLIYDIKEAFRDCLGYIETQKPDIVVTHHAPSYRSVHPRFHSSNELNYSFVSDLDDFILANSKIKLWIHGHVHDPYDYAIGQCRVICNPLGYPGETYKKDSDYQVKIIEV